MCCCCVDTCETFGNFPHPPVPILFVSASDVVAVSPFSEPLMFVCNFIVIVVRLLPPPPMPISQNKKKRRFRVMRNRLRLMTTSKIIDRALQTPNLSTVYLFHQLTHLLLIFRPSLPSFMHPEPLFRVCFNILLYGTGVKLSNLLDTLFAGTAKVIG